MTLIVAFTSPHTVTRHQMAAERLDRLLEVYLAAVDADLARLPHRVGDVGTGHRTEQPVARACPFLDGQHRAVERVGHIVGLLLGLRLVAAAHLILALRLGDARIAGLLGQPPRAEVVAQVAGSDLDDVAAPAKLLDILQQDCLCSSLCHPILSVLGGWARRSMVAWRWRKRHRAASKSPA